MLQRPRAEALGEERRNRIASYCVKALNGQLMRLLTHDELFQALDACTQVPVLASAIHMCNTVSKRIMQAMSTPFEKAWQGVH